MNSNAMPPPSAPRCTPASTPKPGAREARLTPVRPPAMRRAMAIEHRMIQTNGIRLHCAVDGNGPLVVLLHGIPESWRSWRHQLGALAPRFRVVAPDLRGMGESDKPEDVGAYDLAQAAADVLGVIRACGEREAVIVRHQLRG